MEVVHEFLDALNSGKSGADITRFYDSEATQIEYPNLLSKAIIKRNIIDIHEGSVKGTQVISKQKTEIVKAYSLGDDVILEAVWTGTLAIPLGKLAVGEEVKAYFAQFYTFKNGKIILQKNYDCFESFL
jgi:hypothetical protein